MKLDEQQTAAAQWAIEQILERHANVPAPPIERIEIMLGEKLQEYRTRAREQGIEVAYFRLRVKDNGGGNFSAYPVDAMRELQLIVEDTYLGREK